MCVSFCFKCYCKLHLDYNSNWSTPGKPCYYCAMIPPWFCFLQKWGVSSMRERTHWMRRVSRVATTLSTGAGTHGKDSTPLVLEEDHLHSNFTSVRAKTVSGGCCCFLLNSLKNKKSLSSRPKNLNFYNVVLNPESYCIRRKLLFSFVGFGLWWAWQAHAEWGLCCLCICCGYAGHVYSYRWKKTLRCYLGQHLNLELKYMLKDKSSCKYFSGLGPNKHGKGSYSSLYVNKLLVVLSRMIHLPIFFKRKPRWPDAGLMLAVSEVGKRLRAEPVPTITLDKECLGVTVYEIPAHFVIH